MKTTAQIHRFRHRVALSVGTGETVYLLVEEARAISAALDRCALDIEAYSYVDSRLRAVTVNIEGDK